MSKIQHINLPDKIEEPKKNSINIFFEIGKESINKPIDEDGHTWLHFACNHKNLNFVEYLIKHGSDPYIKDNKGLASIHYAVASDSKDIIKYLISEKADIKDFPTNNGETPLHISVFLENIELTKYFLIERANANILNKQGFSALHFAAFSNENKIMEAIFQNGVEIKHENTNNYSALHITSSIGNLETSNSLVTYRADVNLKENTLNWTPIDFAKLAKNTVITNFLIEKGAKDEGTVLTRLTITKFTNQVNWLICNEEGASALLNDALPAVMGVGYKAIAGHTNNLFDAEHIKGAVITTIGTFVIKAILSSQIKPYKDTYCDKKIINTPDEKEVKSLPLAEKFIFDNKDTYLALNQCKKDDNNLMSFTELDLDWHLCKIIGDENNQHTEL